MLACNEAILAAQAPLWKPGTKVAYHPITDGCLMEELLRAAGQDIGTLIRELMSGPLSPDLHLRLPRKLDSQIATIFRADSSAISTFPKDAARRRIVDRRYAGSLTGDQDRRVKDLLAVLARII